MTLETLLTHYKHAPGIWDEMHSGTAVRQQYEKIFSLINHLDVATLKQKELIAGELFMNQGITFTVYS
ncbi:MAG TPA: circularly permuted type 2 ATP-grasp protein, partial [Flavisolibacter sp.]